MAANNYDLKPYEVNTFIDMVMYHMKPEMRRKMMNECPIVYNKVVGREIVKVVHQNEA